MQVMNIKHIITRIAKSPEKTFLLLSLFFGLISAIIVPQLSVSDENMHYLRAYSISMARLESKQCTYPKAIAERAKSVYSGNFISDYTTNIDRRILITEKCGSAVGYSPIMHLPQAIGVGVTSYFGGSTGLSILLGRITNLIFYSIAIFFIIKWVRVGKWVFVSVGLFPLMIHMAASLSSDVATNVAIFTIAAITLNLFSQKTKISRNQFVALLSIAAVLALTKPVNAILLLPLIFLPRRLFVNNNKNLPFNVRKWLMLISLGLVALVSLIVWQKIYNAPLVNSAGVENPLHANPLKFLIILFNTYINPKIGYTDVVFRGLIGEFSSFSYRLPLFILTPSFALLFISLLKNNKQDYILLGKYAKSLAILNISTITIFITAVSYLMFSVWAIMPFRFGVDAYYADGVQGRYFTALAVLLIPIGIWLQKYFRIETKNEKVFNLIMFFGLALVLGFYVFETVWTYK